MKNLKFGAFMTTEYNEVSLDDEPR